MSAVSAAVAETSLVDEEMRVFKKGGSHFGVGAWRALREPVTVALFGGSLQMETRDPFDPDFSGDFGVRVEFSSGKEGMGGLCCDCEDRETMGIALEKIPLGVIHCNRVVPWFCSSRS